MPVVFAKRRRLALVGVLDNLIGTLGCFSTLKEGQTELQGDGFSPMEKMTGCASAAAANVGVTATFVRGLSGFFLGALIKIDCLGAVESLPVNLGVSAVTTHIDRSSSMIASVVTRSLYSLDDLLFGHLVLQIAKGITTGVWKQNCCLRSRSCYGLLRSHTEPTAAPVTYAAMLAVAGNQASAGQWCRYGGDRSSEQGGAKVIRPLPIITYALSSQAAE